MAATGRYRQNRRRIISELRASGLLSDHLDWPGLGQVYRLERQFSWRRQGQVYKTSHDVEFGLTGLSRQQASPARVLAIRRQHWNIETRLHYRRDVTFHEDATRMTIGPAGRILSIVHDLALGLVTAAGFTHVARGLRWFDGHLLEALGLLTGMPRVS